MDKPTKEEPEHSPKPTVICDGKIMEPVGSTVRHVNTALCEMNFDGKTTFSYGFNSTWRGKITGLPEDSA